MGNSEQIIDFSRLKAACSRCNLQELGLPMGLSAPDLARLDHETKEAPERQGDKRVSGLDSHAIR